MDNNIERMKLTTYKIYLDNDTKGMLQHAWTIHNKGSPLRPDYQTNKEKNSTSKLTNDPFFFKI